MIQIRELKKEYKDFKLNCTMSVGKRGHYEIERVLNKA